VSVQRSNEIDVIRLFALVGICVVNVPVMALSVEDFFKPPENLVDQLGVLLVAGLFQLKFFVLFSFVFGWGVHILQRSAISRHQSFKKRYFRRMAGLALLGVLHAVFVFNGDILLPYAVFGTLLWIVIDRPVSSLLRIAKWMIPLSMVCLFVFAISLEFAGITESATQEKLHQLRGGSFLEVTKAQIEQWPFSFFFVVIVQGPLVFGAFVTGLAAAKSNFLSDPELGLKHLRNKLPLLLSIALPINLLFALSSSGFMPSSLELLELIGFVLIPIGAPALTAVYVFLCLHLSRFINFPAIIINAGRNSLSVYVLQGIIVGLILGGYGLGYYSTLGQAMLFPLALVIAVVSILAIGWIAGRFGRGPLEYCLRWISG